MKNSITLLLFTTLSIFTYAQTSDDFSDGDFTNNPIWVGDVADFIVNGNDQLQLDAAAAGDSYLSTAHNLTQLEDQEWRFFLDFGFSPSGSNGGEIYLTATDSDLSTSPDGIFIQIGETGSDDPIRLFERDGGTETEILESTLGIVASPFEISVKIIHRNNGDWELFTDLAGGNAFQLDVSANYPTPIVGSHVGPWVQYTASNISNFIFDDIYVGPIQVDNTPPNLVEANAISINQLEVLFDEGIDQASGEDINNYSVDNGLGNPTSVVRDGTNLALFTLTFADDFNIGDVYNLTTENIEDFEGNTSTSQSDDFQYIESQTPEFGDIIINEFMADETPVVGLPETQFIELYNRSNKYFHLDEWKLSDNNSTGTIQDEWLYPGEYLILVPTSGLTDYPQAINVTSWASLNNTGDDIRLETDGGILVDELTYTDDWYQNPDKEDGGWSIERINPDLPCSDGNNWTASTNPDGGTPGSVNSVLDNTPDTDEPHLINSLASAPHFLTITFDEGMDSLSLVNAVFSSSPSLTVDQRLINASYPKEFTLQFNEAITPGVVHTFELTGFEDCSGNENSFEGTFVVPQQADGDEIIINEILFNPLTSGSDFVELYNRSDKYIDLINWELAKFDDDTISNNVSIEDHYILAPDDYVVLTTDSNFQIANYPFAKPGKFIQLPSLPSYTNDSSTVYLIFFSDVIDKVAYSSDWHFKLLQSDKGVSLERFDAFEPSNDENNWHSASETVGFATPGIKNSQAASPNSGGTVSLSSKSFSPDNDGHEDVLLITYEVDEPTMLGDLVIYDDMGRKVRTLMSSHLLGERGVIKWDGLRDDENKASIGPYIILFEALNAETGEKIAIRKAVTVAGQL
ncbi:MAG: lamin tail domain-containing protein [Brumimicrobium sp.]